MIQTLLGFGLAALFGALFIWLLPIVLILRSDKTAGVEKLLWLLVVLFVSWFAWILYALFAPLGPIDKRRV
ncbi:hypothetical protein [endosymbiont of Ridgeia piscesae]|uniref:Cardiolipin synthase N-terminal domain-containing protein n=1 Tax=endosymbiont of Ridgeia piscesae TaxID=54398 RepID=A0A0T5ZAQ9_9GAMM|nr:hypothetical protein [endosymbiont of Ridgeia piscesae]KRT59952.1 hypothetical protein Ga0076813_16388 [endosymbiont of Ridgeia piscesae]